MTALDDHADRLMETLDKAHDQLPDLARTAVRARAKAKQVEATALLEARTLGHRAKEERQAHATLQAADLTAAADFAEMTYRQQMLYIRTVTDQLELVRTRMVTHRTMQQSV